MLYLGSCPGIFTCSHKQEATIMYLQSLYVKFNMICHKTRQDGCLIYEPWEARLACGFDIGPKQ